MSRSRVHPRLITTLVCLGALLLVEVAARSGAGGGLTLIPVGEMLRGAWQLLVDPTFWSRSALPTATAVLLSFSLAAVVGVPAGLALHHRRFLRAVLDPYLVAYYAIPIFAVYPMLVVIMGVGTAPIVLLGFLFAVVVVIVQTLAGMDGVRAVFPKLADAYALSPVRRMVHVLLPAGAASILAGLKLALSYCIAGVIASEFILSSRGIGRLIATAYNGFDLPSMYGAMILVLVAAMAANLLLDAVARRLPVLAARDAQEGDRR